MMHCAIGISTFKNPLLISGAGSLWIRWGLLLRHWASDFSLSEGVGGLGAAGALAAGAGDGGGGAAGAGAAGAGPGAESGDCSR